MIKIKIITIFMIALFVLPFLNVSGTNTDSFKQVNKENNETKQKYAIIIVGSYFNRKINIPSIKSISQYYKWYLNDAGKTYTMLRDRYNYSEENIFLLVNLLPESFFEIPTKTFNKSWIDGKANKENLKEILNSFKLGGKRELSEKDQLLFLMINHGGIYDDGGIEWITPDGFIDNNWKSEEKALDDSDENFAYYDKAFDNEWTEEPLILTTNKPIKIKGFRIKASKNEYLNKINIKFYNNSQLVKIINFEKNDTVLQPWIDKIWKHLAFRNETNQEIEEYEIDEIRISFHEKHPLFGYKLNPGKIYGFQLWQSDDSNDIKKAFFALPFKNILEMAYWIVDPSPSKTNNLYDWELQRYLENISGKIILLFQPCYGGAFINKISGKNRIICTSSRGFEPSDAWIGKFRDALNMIVPADYNNDSKISIAEAYEYAARWVEERYGNLFHPLIDDNGDKIGTHYKQEGFDQNNKNKDGFNASNTFL